MQAHANRLCPKRTTDQRPNDNFSQTARATLPLTTLQHLARLLASPNPQVVTAVLRVLVAYVKKP